MKKVSILIGVYNGAKDLKKTFQSIYDQTYTNWEIIAVEDGSKDDSWEFLQKQAEKHPGKVKVIQNESNRGLTQSLIRAAENATGELFARLDIGDTYMPEKLKRQVQFLEDHPDHVLVGSFYKNGQDLIKPPISDREIRASMMRRNPFAHSAIMVRAKTYKTSGGYNPKAKYGQDYDLWFRIIALGKAANFPEMLCVRDIDENGISYKNQRGQMVQCLKTQLKNMSPFNPYHYFCLLEPLGMILAPEVVKRFVRGIKYRK